MARSGLMAYVSGENRSGDEVRYESLHVCQIAAAIVAYVDDKPGGCAEIVERVGNVARPYGRSKRRVANITDIVGNESILQSGRRVIVDVEILLLHQSGGIILRICAPTLAVVRYVEG